MPRFAIDITANQYLFKLPPEVAPKQRTCCHTQKDVVASLHIMFSWAGILHQQLPLLALVVFFL
ncbi:hypothetical protein [Chitinophaga ginsengisoli]|uniref:hypothetical protein n=1 Tax=Chitinophaga ginsengisoli TaxID=363837 RepID=UPI0011B23183|nr:hypothetical protein [Chitinophaga ginsengisoli]